MLISFRHYISLFIYIRKPIIFNFRWKIHVNGTERKSLYLEKVLKSNNTKGFITNFKLLKKIYK